MPNKVVSCQYSVVSSERFQNTDYRIRITESVDELVIGRVKSVLNSGFVHNVVFTNILVVAKPGFCTQVLQNLRVVFAPTFGAGFNLLAGRFSTQSTGPIIKTTNLINY